MTRIGGFCVSMVRTCIGLEEESVVHVARGMIRREIQLGEIVIVGFDIRPFGDGETHFREDRREFIHDLRDRMYASLLFRTRQHRQSDVDLFGGEPRLELLLLQDHTPLGQSLGDLILDRIDGRALHLALLRRHLAERRQQGRYAAFLAERGDPHGFQRAFIRGGGHLCKRFHQQGIEVRHHIHPVGIFGAFAMHRRQSRDRRAVLQAVTSLIQAR